jgi:hypothetical protein
LLPFLALEVAVSRMDSRHFTHRKWPIPEEIIGIFLAF